MKTHCILCGQSSPLAIRVEDFDTILCLRCSCEFTVSDLEERIDQLTAFARICKAARAATDEDETEDETSSPAPPDVPGGIHQPDLVLETNHMTTQKILESTPADLYRAWGKTVLALRQAAAEVDAFDEALTPGVVAEAVEALRDPSGEDLEEALPAIRWQLRQALQLLNNCPPDAVQYLTGELEPREGEAGHQVYARTLRRDQARRDLGIEDAANDA